jgi:glycosyltransferase involved in cell wall biosynthesis
MSCVINCPTPGTAGERLRVLLWCWGRRGGGPRYTLEAARALGRLPSLDLALSLSRQSELWAETRALGLPIFEVDTYQGLMSAAWRTLAVPRLARRFAAYLDARRIELVVCTMIHPWSGWVAPRIRAPGRSYVFTAHDAAPHPGDRFVAWDPLMRANLRCADGVLLLSEHARDQLIARYRYPPQRTWVAPHGPLAFPGQALRHDPPDRARRLLFFGRILPYKGLALLLEAFASIADRHDLHLAVVGSGTLDARAARLAVHPRIRLDNRWIPESEVAAILASADLVVVPCVEASQSGVVAAAYGMGVPVVVTPVGGLREQVIAGETGLVAAEVTARALADAILTLCTDGALYARCREGATRAGRIDDAWREIAERMAAFFWHIRREAAV